MDKPPSLVHANWALIEVSRWLLGEIAMSVLYKKVDSVLNGLLIAGIIILMLGLLLRNFLGVNARFDLNEKESFLFTAIIWIVVPLMGALPYLFTSSVTNFTDAKLLAELSEDLGEAMVGINEKEIEMLMAQRGE